MCQRADPCAQTRAHRHAQSHKHVGTLQHYAPKPLSQRWQNCIWAPTSITHPHLAELLGHRQVATRHNHITDWHANVQYTPRQWTPSHACALEGDPPTLSLETVGPHRYVCAGYISKHTHYQSITHRGATREHSLSTITSTRLAQSRDPGCPGHTRHDANGMEHLIVSAVLPDGDCGAFGRALANGTNKGAHQPVPGRVAASGPG